MSDHSKKWKPAHYDVAPGTKVVYMDCNGHARENVEAREAGLVVDGVYEVQRADIYDSCSYFHLKGIPGRHNTVMFTLAEDSPPLERDFAKELGEAQIAIETLTAERDDARTRLIDVLTSYESFLKEINTKLAQLQERLNGPSNSAR